MLNTAATKALIKRWLSRRKVQILRRERSPDTSQVGFLPFISRRHVDLDFQTKMLGCLHCSYSLNGKALGTLAGRLCGSNPTKSVKTKAHSKEKHSVESRGRAMVL